MPNGGCLKRTVLGLSISLALAGCASTGEDSRQQSRVSAINPASANATTNLSLARSEFARGNYGNAIDILERELAQKPASVAALNGLGACYDQLGRYDVAQRYYFRALDLAPESSTTLSNIGYSYLQQGRHREAVAVLELALQQDGANQVAANNLSMAMTGLGDAGSSPTAGSIVVQGGAQPGEDTDIQALLARLNRTAGADAVQAVEAGPSGVSRVRVFAATPDTTSVEPVRRTVDISRVEPLDPAPTLAVPEGQTGIPAVSSRLASLDIQAERYPTQIETLQPAIASRSEGLQSPAAPDTASPAEQPAIEAFAAPQPAVPETVTAVAPEPQPLETEPEPLMPVPELPAPEPLASQTLVAAAEGQSTPNALVTSSIAVVTDVIAPVPSQIADAQPAAAPDAQPLTLTILETPELDPARVSDVAPAMSVRDAPLNLVVENGNGVRGIARATSSYLRGDQLSIVGISDADNFDYERTVIYHRPEMAGYALEIAASLNLDCDFETVTDLGRDADVRVVLGHDFARQVNVERGWLSFDRQASTDYLSGTIRLEVANGNGVQGMAARVRSYLQEKGGSVSRITNADSFDYRETILYHRPGVQVAVEGLLAELPISGVRLLEDANLPADIDARLVIGQDFIPIQTLVSN